MTDLETTIEALTDDQLEDEIAETTPNICCATPWAAAKSFCGCGGRASDYLDRLLAEVDRRWNA